MITIKEGRYMAYEWGDWRRRGCPVLDLPASSPIANIGAGSRATRRDYSPNYFGMTDIAKRFEQAYQQIEAGNQLLIYCRYACQMSDARLMEWSKEFTSRHKARHAVDSAMREIVRIL